MKIKTKFELEDRIVYLEKDKNNGNKQIIKQGKISLIKVEIPRNVEINISYVLYDKTIVHEMYCYSSLEELKEQLLKSNEFRIKNLSISSII